MAEQIIGKKSHDIAFAKLREKIETYAYVVVDLGCGDGILPYRLARENPEFFYIGIDAAREPLAEVSAKAAKKPSRGGCDNILFLCANVLEALPELESVADEIQWNFPWGSLMYALVQGEETALKNMCAVAKPGALFTFYLNLYVFENETQRKDMGLPEVDQAFVENTLIPSWKKSGLEVERSTFLPAEALKTHPSTWAGRLVRRSGRNTLMLTGQVVHGA